MNYYLDWMKDSELTKPLLEPAPGSSVEVGTHLRLLALTVDVTSKVSE